MGKNNLTEFEILKASVNYADNYFEMHETNHYKALRQGFKAGAEWASRELAESYTMEDMINYAFWLRYNDTEENAEQYFGYTNQDMLREWKTKHRQQQ